MDDDFYLEKLKHCLSIYDTNLFFDELWEEYGVYETLESFQYMNQSTFYSFFDTHSIDVPKCFEKTLSVKRFINELNLLKFNNYFMRDGQRYKSFRYLSKSI
jgi:hypothetical protein